MTISIACDSCRAPNAQGAKFCRQCGAPLAAAAPPQAVHACPGCGQQVAGTQKFCRGCGQPLAAAATQDMAARIAATSAAAAQAVTEAPPAAARMPPPEQAGSTTRRVLPHPPEMAVRSSSKSAIPKTRRRKVWPWTVAGGLLAAIGLTAGLVYFGKLTLPTAAQRLVQDYVPVRALEFRVGDSWAYESSDFSSRHPANIASSSFSRRVIAVDGNRITIENSDPMATKNLTVIDRKKSTIEHSGESTDGTHFRQSFDPPLLNYDFPLQPGKTWRLTSMMTSNNGTADRYTIVGKVLGWERNIGRLDGVMVDGLKLSIETTIADSSGNVSSIDSTKEWYVPAAGRSVVIRSVTRHLNDYRGAFTSTYTSRLTSFIPTDITDTE